LTNFDDFARKTWWKEKTADEQKKALDAVGAKNDEAGIIAAWNHYKAPREAELLRQQSLEMPIPKDNE
jgi:hypothetical protein